MQRTPRFLLLAGLREWGKFLLHSQRTDGFAVTATGAQMLLGFSVAIQVHCAVSWYKLEAVKPASFQIIRASKILCTRSVEPQYITWNREKIGCSRRKCWRDP